MRRRTFDALVSATGLLLAAVLLIAGGLLTWGHVFVSNQVHNQLVAQKIVFPTTTNPEFKALPKADAAAMAPYAGQTMTTGAQAQAYADHFIAVHLQGIGGGKTYSQLSAEAMAQPTNTARPERSPPCSRAPRCGPCCWRPTALGPSARSR